MSKIDKTSVVYILLEAVAVSVAGIILWPILDLLYHNIITHSDFNYSVFEHIVGPIVFGCFWGIISWINAILKSKRGKTDK